jgi:hypothetical protein
VLAAIPRLLAAGLQPSNAQNANDYLPKQIIAKGYAQDHSRKSSQGPMNRLMGRGRLKRQIVGKYSNRTDRFGLVLT